MSTTGGTPNHDDEVLEVAIFSTGRTLKPMFSTY